MRSLNIITILFLLLVSSPTLALESSYSSNNKFMPITPPMAKPHSSKAIISQPAKFFPLTQSRFPTPARDVEKVDSILTEEHSQPQAVKIFSKNKTNMSQEQAQQILFIFDYTK